MKKFMRISLITAGILALVGFVFCLIGGAVSGKNFLISMKNDAYMERRLEDARRVVEEVERELGVSKTEGGSVQGSGTQNADNSSSGTQNGGMQDGSVQEYHIETVGIRELDLSLGAGNFIISEKDAEDGLIDLYVSGTGRCDYFIKEHTLHVEGFKGVHMIGIDELKNSITLRIPKGMSLDEVDLEIGAGIMDISNLRARELDAIVGAGELTINNVETDDFSVEIGAGSLEAGGMYAREADLEVGLGNCSYEGTIAGSLDAECDMGSMDFLIKGKEEDHNYEIECRAGNIYISGYEFSGLAAEKYINYNAASTYELTCNMGNITLDFQ
ncbi:MAG: DUF4097 domain-containing protein [Clostridium sp.]|nr:DUF4097 domain-containing protein [Clostridium sp.]